jgi:O-antigen ligase
MSTLIYGVSKGELNPAFMLSIGFVLVAAVAIAVLDMTIVAGVVVVPWIIWLFYQRPMLLVCLWPALSLIDVFFPSAAFFRAGGIKFLTLDPAYFFTITHLGLYALRFPKKVATTIKEHKLLVIFLGLIAVSILVYTPMYGQSAIGEARKFYFVFLFPLLAVLSIKETSDLKRLVLVIVGVACVIAAVALYRAVMQHTIVRVLNSEATLIVAVAAFSLLLLRINKLVLINPLLDSGLLSGFSLLALASGQRSVWLSIGLGSMLLLWLYRRRAVFMVKAFTIAGAILVGLTLAIIAFPEAGAKLAEKFAGIIDPYSDKTASWRIRGWEAQLQTLAEVNPVFGEGLGGYYSWKLGSYEVNNFPHNAYVQMLLKFGVLGLLLYTLLVLEFFRKALAVRSRLGQGPMRAYLEIGIVCFGAVHGYLLGYGFEPITLVFFAVALSAMNLYRQMVRDYKQFRLGEISSNSALVQTSLPTTRGVVLRIY